MHVWAFPELSLNNLVFSVFHLLTFFVCVARLAKVCIGGIRFVEKFQAGKIFDGMRNVDKLFQFSIFFGFPEKRSIGTVQVELATRRRDSTSVTVTSATAQTRI